MQNQYVQPDKVINYSPPEIGRSIQISFFLHKPENIFSPTLSSKKNALLIYDANLDDAKVKLTLSILRRSIKRVTAYKLNYGPKDLTGVKKIWNEMIKVHPEVAIALGGGTTCDLVGFASSCYHRGLDHLFFPTTLLSMVDASIGGKTGIDFGRIKNSIGHVHYALESYCIFPFSKTLEYEELISGFSEVIKAGMLFDENLIKLIEELPSKFSLTQGWFNAVTKGAELKARISEKPFSQRSKLLYGHNIGHGIETYNTTHRRHGDCVAIGMNYELAIGVVANLIDKNVWERQNQLLKKFKLPTLFPKEIDFEIVKKKDAEV